MPSEKATGKDRDVLLLEYRMRSVRLGIGLIQHMIQGPVCFSSPPTFALKQPQGCWRTAKRMKIGVGMDTSCFHLFW